MILFNSLLGNSKANVFLLIAGQSNAVGITDNVAPPTEYQGSITGAKIIANGQLETLNYPNNNKGTLFGSEISFSKDYVNLTGRTLYLAKEAYSGKGIAKVDNEEDFNTQSNELIAPLLEAVRDLKDKSYSGGNSKFVFYWNQGERDSALGNGNLYYQNLKDIIDAINGIWKIDLGIICALNRAINSGGLYPDVDLVRNAQLQLISENNYLEVIDMEDAKYSFNSDGLHYTADSQIQLGRDVLSICQSKLNLL